MSTVISNLPNASDPATFSPKAFGAWGQLAAFSEDVNVLWPLIEAAAAAATAAAGAAMWASGGGYALGSVAWSPITKFTYRRIVAGAGITDPSADAVNWQLANPAQMVPVDVTGTTQAAAAGARYRLKNVASSTVTLPAAPASNDAIAITASNLRTDNVVARNGKLIAGLAEDLTLSIAGETITLAYDGLAGNWELINV
jgi:hypothetical protein